MRIGDIYKSNDCDVFIMIINYLHRMDELDDTYITIGTLDVIDDEVCVNPFTYRFGTQEQIEAKYSIYADGADFECIEGFEEHLKSKILEQQHADDKNLDKLLGGMKQEYMDKLKEDIDKLINEYKEKNK